MQNRRQGGDYVVSQSLTMQDSPEEELQTSLYEISHEDYESRSSSNGSNLLNTDGSSEFFSDSSDDTAVVATVATGMLVIASDVVYRLSQQGSRSQVGKAPNRDIGRAEGAVRLDRDYFCRLPCNTMLPLFEKEFERR